MENIHFPVFDAEKLLDSHDSHWLKIVLQSALSRDSNAAAEDARKLYEILDARRCQEVVASNPTARPD